MRGLPLPAQDYVEGNVELPRWMAPNPAFTFLFKVGGHSMIKARISPGDLLVESSSRIRSGGSGTFALAPGSTSQAEARSAEHRANAGRSAAPASRGCDGHSALRTSWHSVISHDRNGAMVSDHGFCPMISDDHGLAVISNDHGLAMIPDHGWHAMIAHHEAAAIVAAVTG